MALASQMLRQAASCGMVSARPVHQARPPARRRALVRASAPATPTSDAQQQQQAQAAAPRCPMGYGGANFASSEAAAAASQPRHQLTAEELASLHGSGWRVLSEGNVDGLPEPAGRLLLNPLQLLVGESAELEKGVGPFLLDRFRQFGPVFSWKLGPYKLVAVLEHETIKSLLKADSKVIVGWVPPSMHAILGDNSKRNLENPVARMISRKLLAPGFSNEALRHYIDKLEAICYEQLEAWAASEAPTNIGTVGKALSFEFSVRLLVDFKVAEQQKPDIKHKLDTMFQAMISTPLNLPGTRFHRGLKAKQALVEDIKAIIAANKAATGAHGSSVLEYSLEAKRRIDEQLGEAHELTPTEIAETGIGLLIAGNDTSGLGMTGLLGVLPLFPEVMARLRAEQEEVVARHGPGLSLRILNDEMPYADAVVKEVLRVVPPSANVLRQTTVDLEIGGRFVPKGSMLYLSSFLAQVLTDPSLGHKLDGLTAEQLAALEGRWSPVDAAGLRSDFKPERWLRSGAQQQPGSTRPQLMTFSQGPHACLGMTLFMAEAKVLLALLARRYTLEPLTPAELQYNVTFFSQLRPAGSDVRVRVAPAPLPVACAGAGRGETVAA